MTILDMPTEALDFFVLIGMTVVAVILSFCGVMLCSVVSWVIGEVLDYKKIGTRCPKCGAYVRWYKDRRGIKRYYINYCPKCGHDMWEERTQLIMKEEHNG